MVVIGQHFLTISAQNMAVSSNVSETTSSYSVQWQVCGPGTRFPRERVAGAHFGCHFGRAATGRYIEGLVAN